MQEYLWYRDQELIGRGAEFQISSVSRDDDGEYWCEAQNSEGEILASDWWIQSHTHL